MKILVHDYSGHPFQIQLSRELARRGHEVTHAYSAAIDTPRGSLAPRGDDPANFQVLPISKPGMLRKYDFVHRALAERRYGVLLADAILAARPDAVIVSNTPNDVLDILRARLPRSLHLIWWVQDIYSVGIRSVLNRRFPLAGTLIGWLYRAKEKHFARRANRIVAITRDFNPFLEGLGVPPAKIAVIENWAPLDEIAPRPHDNDWKREQGFTGKKIIFYSGTLGLKHNPAVLADAAAHYQALGRDDVIVVVASQGLGADFLKREAESRGLRNLKILPWQPYERLSESLSAADILTALIEPEAGMFSVPSKVLSSLCAGRPIVAAIPLENLAARTITHAEAGFVVAPGETAAFIARLDTLIADADLRVRMGANARAYAEEMFDIAKIAGRFIALAHRV